MFDDSNSTLLNFFQSFQQGFALQHTQTITYKRTQRHVYIYTISNTSIQLGTTCARVLHKISIILSTITKQPSLYYITSLYWIILTDSELGVRQMAQYQCNVYFRLYMQMILIFIRCKGSLLHEWNDVDVIPF